MGAVWTVSALLLGSASAHAVTLEELVRHSDRIVEANLWIEGTAVETVMVNPQGDPARIVCTYVAVQPVEHLKGAPASRLILRILGGTLGDYAYVCPEMPAVASGDKAVLFLGRSETLRSATGEEAYYLSYGAEALLPRTSQEGRPAVLVAQGTAALGLVPGDSVGDTWVTYARLRELVAAAQATSLSQ
jgi:hypothetical protein